MWRRAITMMLALLALMSPAATSLAASRDAVLTVHHTSIQTMTATGAFKLIENPCGGAWCASCGAGSPGLIRAD
jgi:hypothetical protein